MKKILYIALTVLVLAACSAKPKAGFTAAAANLVVDGKTLTPGMDYSTPVLGKPSDPAKYYEAASCAYDGLDKIYTYDTIAVYTYPSGSKDYILEIDLLASGKTAAGIKIGSTLAQVEAAYGTAHTAQGLNIVYTDGKIAMVFQMDNGIVKQISLTYSPS